MRILLILASFFLLAACDEQKTAAERTEEIETFADPQIKAYNEAKAVQGVVDAADKKQQDEMIEDDL